MLVTTLTKRMAEELTSYYQDVGIRVRYLHSEVPTIERTEILRDLRNGDFDVLVGINLLREGLDLPEVSLVAILDADKEGFLRSTRSLIQTMGRAARNVRGTVFLYADKETDSMRNAMDETGRRREAQREYNLKNGITPKTVESAITTLSESLYEADYVTVLEGGGPRVQRRRAARRGEEAARPDARRRRGPRLRARRRAARPDQVARGGVAPGRLRGARVAQCQGGRRRGKGMRRPKGRRPRR